MNEAEPVEPLMRKFIELQHQLKDREHLLVAMLVQSGGEFTVADLAFDRYNPNNLPLVNVQYDPIRRVQVLVIGDAKNR